MASRQHTHLEMEGMMDPNFLQETTFQSNNPTSRAEVDLSKSHNQTNVPNVFLKNQQDNQQNSRYASSKREEEQENVQQTVKSHKKANSQMNLGTFIQNNRPKGGGQQKMEFECNYLSL